MFGILRDVCLAGSSFDARLATGFSSAGGAGSGQAEVSGGAVSRKLCRPCGVSWH